MRKKKFWNDFFQIIALTCLIALSLQCVYFLISLIIMGGWNITTILFVTGITSLLGFSLTK